MDVLVSPTVKSPAPRVKQSAALARCRPTTTSAGPRWCRAQPANLRKCAPRHSPARSNPRPPQPRGTPATAARATPSQPRADVTPRPPQPAAPSTSHGPTAPPATAARGPRQPATGRREAESCQSAIPPSPDQAPIARGRSALACAPCATPIPLTTAATTASDPPATDQDRWRIGVKIRHECLHRGHRRPCLLPGPAPPALPALPEGASCRAHAAGRAHAGGKARLMPGPPCLAGPGRLPGGPWAGCLAAPAGRALPAERTG